MTRPAAPGPEVRSAARTAAGHPRVVVLHGGRSGERAVSLDTGSGVLEALRGPRDEHEPCTPSRVDAVEWCADGAFELGGERLAWHELVGRLRAGPHAADVAFLALHGGEGEDGTLQGALELAGLPYTGSGVHASALCMDKPLAKAAVSAAGLRAPSGRVLWPGDWARERTAVLAELGRTPASGWFVKPSRGGSSVATTFAPDAAALARALDADDCAETWLVEPRVLGIEATVAVLGRAGRVLRSLPVVEIQAAPGRFFDYEQKYSTDGAAEHCPPRHLDRDACAALDAAARTAFSVLGCSGLARIDFVWSEGVPVFLEANTLPGLTERSLAPLAARAIGWSYRRLCCELVSLALG